MKKKSQKIWFVVVAAVLLSAGYAFYESPSESDRPTDASACDPKSCEECAPGLISKTLDGECCPRCVGGLGVGKSGPSCEDVSCEECPEGTRAQRVLRKCCAECVQVDAPACERGRQTYAALKPSFDSRLVECEHDDDCTLASYSDACQTSCPAPLNKMQLGPVIEELRREAQTLCRSCLPSTFECPNLNTKKVVCKGGRCEFGEEEVSKQ